MATFDVILRFKQNLRVFLCVYVYSFLFAENLSFCATFQFQIFSPKFIGLSKTLERVDLSLKVDA